MIEGILAAFGANATLAGVLYASALAGLAEASKRALSGRLGRRLTSGEISVLVATLGALTGPAVWPWIWPMIAPDVAAPDLGASIVLGVGTSGVAHIIYPAVLERVLNKIRTGEPKGDEDG